MTLSIIIHIQKTCNGDFVYSQTPAKLKIAFPLYFFVPWVGGRGGIQHLHVFTLEIFSGKLYWAKGSLNHTNRKIKVKRVCFAFAVWRPDLESVY